MPATTAPEKESLRLRKQGGRAWLRVGLTCVGARTLVLSAHNGRAEHMTVGDVVQLDMGGTHWETVITHVERVWRTQDEDVVQLPTTLVVAVPELYARCQERRTSEQEERVAG